MKKEETIVVDFDDKNSIRNAEIKKSRLENSGYKEYETRQIGFNKFRMKMRRL